MAEKVSLGGSPTKSCVRVNLAKEVNPLVLLGNSPQRLKLPTQEPKMVQKQRLAHGRRGYDQRDQEHSVKVASLRMLSVLLDSARDGNQRALKIAKILSGSDDGGVHMVAERQAV